jgi:hypothetical protein
MMKPAVWVFPCVIAVVLFSSCGHSDAPQTHFQSTPVVADGQDNDWTHPLRFSNSQYTLSYNVTNDLHNIYICVLTKDDVMQRRILSGGMDVYFDPKGGKDKKMDLAFPERNADAGRSTPANNTAAKQSLVAAANTYNTAGFPGIDNGQVSSTYEVAKIKVGLRLNTDSTLVYEAIVPINAVLGHELNAKALKKGFSVGIVVGELPGGRLNQQGNSQGGGYRPRMSMGGGGMRGGMGMGMGGMRGGGGRGGQNANRPKEEALWYTFRFADK